MIKHNCIELCVSTGTLWLWELSFWVLCLLQACVFCFGALPVFVCIQDLSSRNQCQSLTSVREMSMISHFVGNDRLFGRPHCTQGTTVVCFVWTLAKEYGVCLVTTLPLTPLIVCCRNLVMCVSAGGCGRDYWNWWQRTVRSRVKRVESNTHVSAMTCTSVFVRWEHKLHVSNDAARSNCSSDSRVSELKTEQLHIVTLPKLRGRATFWFDLNY